VETLLLPGTAALLTINRYKTPGFSRCPSGTRNKTERPTPDTQRPTANLQHTTVPLLGGVSGGLELSQHHWTSFVTFFRSIFARRFRHSSTFQRMLARACPKCRVAQSLSESFVGHFVELGHFQPSPRGSWRASFRWRACVGTTNRGRPAPDGKRR